MKQLNLPRLQKASAFTRFALCVFLLVAGIPQVILAADNNSLSDVLYVAPTTGVNIRTEPSLQAPVLAKLKYNTVVTVLPDSLSAQPLEVKVSDFTERFLTLRGHWVKVKAGKLTGYVFDGMLSKYKGLELGNHNNDAYYAATFGKPVKKVIPKSEVVQGHKVDYETVIMTYPRGFIEEHTLFDSCHDLKYTFKTSFNEAYWLIERMLVDGDAVQEAQIKQEGNDTILTWYSCA